MTPAVVVDVGNTSIKWGRCAKDGIAGMATLSPDDPVAWEKQIRSWELETLSRNLGLAAPLIWVVTGVNPERCRRLAGWLRHNGQDVREIESSRILPLRIEVEHPEKVGMDRLFDAIAANAYRQPQAPAIIVDAGSAVTVDFVDETGVFRGGAIMPGLRLMAEALHDYTSLLPRIEVPRTVPSVPGTSTAAAMQAGVYWGVIGGIRALLAEYKTRSDLYLTGGDGPFLAPALGLKCWPR